MLLLPVVSFEPALAPSAMLFEPVVLLLTADAPLAVLGGGCALEFARVEAVQGCTAAEIHPQTPKDSMAKESLA